MAPFVGRVRELEALAELAARVRSTGRPGVAVVVAEPGAGKTRLLAELRTRHHFPHELPVVGYEPERRVPLTAASEILRRLGLAGPGFDRLSGGALEPLRLFESALRAMGRMGPVLMTVDDLQWVDDLSLALIHYLVRGSIDPGRPLLLVAASRHGETAGRLVASFRGSLPVPFGLIELELGPLGRADGIRLARAIAPDVGPEDAAAFWSTAAGAPFWLEILARSRGDPGGIEAILGVRTRGAGPDARRILALLAILGRPAAISELVAIEDWSETRGEAAVDELVDRGLLARTPMGVRIGHDLIRSSVVSALVERDRRTVHRRIAAHLEADGTDDIQVLKAALEHRRSGGLPTVDLALRLARSPRRRWLGRDGARLLAEVADEPGAEHPGRFDLQEAVAQLATEQADHELAFELWSLVAERGVGARALEASVAAAREAYHLGRIAEARRWIERTRPRVVGQPELTIALDLVEALIAIWIDNRLDTGWAMARRALAATDALAVAAGGIDGLSPDAYGAHVEALLAACAVALQSEDWPALREHSERLVDATVGRDEVAHLEALVWAGIAGRVAVGDVADAQVRFLRAWNEAQRRILPAAAVNAGYWLAYSLQDLGELAEAARVASEVSALAARIGDHARVRARSRTVVHELALVTGDRRAASAVIIAAAEQLTDAHARIAFHQQLAAWQGILGGPSAADEASGQLVEARRQADLAGCPRCAGELDVVSAETLVRVGRPAEARSELARWIDGRHRPDAYLAIQERRLTSMLAGAEGDTERAVAGLLAVIAEADRLGRRLEVVVTRLDLATVLRAVDRARAAAAFRAAAEEADRIGARNLVAVAERELRHLGVRTWRRTASAPSGEPATVLQRLSGRELEVARLVATGMSNPEIADRLVVSRKTVERHVSNVLAKAGVRNRTELAVALSDESGEATVEAPAPSEIEGVPR